MKKLTENLYIDSDPDCFTLYEKRTVQDKNSKNFGNESFPVVGYYATYEQVSQKIAEIGVKEYINKDWLQCVDFVNEAHANFLSNVKELLSKRYGKTN